MVSSVLVGEHRNSAMTVSVTQGGKPRIVIRKNEDRVSTGGQPRERRPANSSSTRWQFCTLTSTADRRNNVLERGDVRREMTAVTYTERFPVSENRASR